MDCQVFYQQIKLYSRKGGSLSTKGLEKIFIKYIDSGAEEIGSAVKALPSWNLRSRLVVHDTSYLAKSQSVEAANEGLQNVGDKHAQRIWNHANYGGNCIFLGGYYVFLNKNAKKNEIGVFRFGALKTPRPLD